MEIERMLPSIIYSGKTIYKGNDEQKPFIVTDKNSKKEATIKFSFYLFKIYHENNKTQGKLYSISFSYDEENETLSNDILPVFVLKENEISSDEKICVSIFFNKGKIKDIVRNRINLNFVAGDDIIKFTREFYHQGFLLKDHCPQEILTLKDVEYLLNSNRKPKNKINMNLPDIDDKSFFDNINKTEKRSYIQAVNNGIYVRSYLMYSDDENKYYYEYERIFINNNLNVIFFSKDIDDSWYKSGNNIAPCEMIVNICGHDDLSNSKIKYFDLDKYFLYRIMYPGIDNALKIGLTNIIDYVSRFSSESVSYTLLKLFGEVHLEEKSFKKMVNMSNPLLLFLNDNKRYMEYIPWFRRIFEDKVFTSIDDASMKKYLTDSCFLFDILDDRNRYNLTDILKILISSKGINNFEKYIKYLTQYVEERHFISFYLDYLNMCVCLGIPFEWNVKDIYEAHDEVTQIFNLLEDQAISKKYNEEFFKIKKNISIYEYKNDTFSIIAPASVEDIINEGIKLHHCVKSYIQAICEGKTNILFIRRNDDIDTPFFTLEIRDNNVRQCHGACNSPMSDEVKELIKEYAKVKRVSVDWANNALAVN